MVVGTQLVCSSTAQIRMKPCACYQLARDHVNLETYIFEDGELVASWRLCCWEKAS